MKSIVFALSVAIASAGWFPLAAEAKRIGGGASSGMQRSMPARTPPTATPGQPAQATPNAPANAGAGAAPAPRRSWMGPIAGLAAGLGIAALMSHFGMGAEFGNLIMMLLLAGVAFFAVRLLMNRLRGMPANQRAGAMASPGGAQFAGMPQQTRPFAPAAATMPNVNMAPSAPLTPAVPSGSVLRLPVGFDADGFERIAKMIFIRMQAANDSGDLNDLRAFTTPEMFAAIKLDLQDRGSAPNQTDVVRVDAEILDFVTEAQRQIVSLRFHGLIRENVGGAAEPFDEVWHLVKPVDGSSEWAVAGIQQGVAA